MSTISHSVRIRALAKDDLTVCLIYSATELQLILILFLPQDSQKGLHQASP
jgi:hypothetical protein